MRSTLSIRLPSFRLLRSHYAGQPVSQEQRHTYLGVHADNKNYVAANRRPFPKGRRFPYIAHKGAKYGKSRGDDEPGQGKNDAADSPLPRAELRFAAAQIGPGNEKRQHCITDQRYDGAGTIMYRIGPNRYGNDKKAHKHALT